MRRIVWPALVALTAGEYVVTGILWGGLVLLVLAMVVAVAYQWRISRQVSRYEEPADPEEVDWESLGRAIMPGDAAASDVYVGLMQDDRPTGPRKRARVLLDGSVRFVRPVFLPIPPDGYDEVAIWTEDESFRGAPMVRLSPWLCATELADGRVAIANLTA